MKQKVAQILELQKVRLLKYILVSQSTFSALLETNGCPNQIKLDNICVEKRRCLEDLMDTAVHSLLNWKVYLEPSKKQKKRSRILPNSNSRRDSPHVSSEECLG